MHRVVILSTLLILALANGCEEEAPPSGGGGSGSGGGQTRMGLSPEMAAELTERLEAAYREDKVAAGMSAASDVVAAGAGANDRLVGLAARALYRAGDFGKASQLVNAAPTSSSDVALLLTRARLARATGALALAEASLEAGLKTAPDHPEMLNELFYLRFGQQRFADAIAAADRLEKALGTAKGYPTDDLKVVNAGRAAFLRQIGEKPVNVVAQIGTQKMVWAQPESLQQPYVVEVKIDGKGPLKLAIDLVGGHAVYLKPPAAETVGLKPVAEGQVLTLAGPRPGGWALIPSLELGTAKLERVITRIFDEPAKPDQVFDGVIGAGVLRDVRLRMNFTDQRFELEASGAFPAGGSDHGVEQLFYLADERPAFISQFEGAPRLATLGSYFNISTITEPVLLERFSEAQTTLLPTLARGIPAAHPMAPLGDPKDYTEEELACTHPSRFGMDKVDSHFCGRDAPLVFGVAMPFNDAFVEKVLGARADVCYSTDISPRMHVLSIDGPTRKVQIQWVPVPAPATAPATAPASQPAAGASAAPATQPSSK